MVNSTNENHFTDFNSQLISLANIVETPDEMLKNPDTIDKINKLLDDHCLELEDPNNQIAIRSLKDRIVRVCDTQPFDPQTDSEALLLKVQLIGIGDRLSGDNVNNFNSKLIVLAKKTPDETLKNPHIIDKIEKLLEKHPEELVNRNNLAGIHLLKERFSSLFMTMTTEESEAIKLRLMGVTDLLMKSEFYLSHIDEPLRSWVMEPGQAPGELREKAGIAIMGGFIFQSNQINLSGCNLTSLPEIIGHLTWLKNLDLKGNNLTNLPESIGNLTQLKKIDLKDNQLTNLPNTIGQLRQLKKLYVENNQLTRLPITIGLLTQLTDLYCDNNQLISLPVTLGNLINLAELSLKNNAQLEELPLSIGRLPNLLDLYTDGTRITEEQREALWSSYDALQNDSENLISQVTLWLEIGKKELDLQNFQEQLTDTQKVILLEWLIRLEFAEDFQHNQQQLAATVCDMLSTLTKDKEFKEFFFIQAEVNNAACDDRASMSLNEIYTYWKICMLQKDTSISTKLEIIVSAAKTFALRNAISQVIEHQKERGNVRETVEIYLYYETLLREKLGLLSAVQNMRYHEIGKRDWINEADLERSVESMYKKELIDQPAFKALIEQNESFTDPWGLIHLKYANKINDLDNQKTSLKEEEYRVKSEVIMAKRNEKWKETALEWFEQQLAPPSSSSRKRSSSNSTEDENLGKKRKT